MREPIQMKKRVNSKKERQETITCKTADISIHFSLKVQYQGFTTTINCPFDQRIIYKLLEAQWSDGDPKQSPWNELPKFPTTYSPGEFQEPQLKLHLNTRNVPRAMIRKSDRVMHSDSTQDTDIPHRPDYTKQLSQRLSKYSSLNHTRNSTKFRILLRKSAKYLPHMISARI